MESGNFPAVGAFDHQNGPTMGHLNSFLAQDGGDLHKNVPKIQMPGNGGGGDVKASI